MLRCNLSILLAERNLKIAQVSKDAGISRTTFTSLALNNAKGIQYDTLNTLCTYLQIKPNQLFEHLPIEIEIDHLEVNNNSLNGPSYLADGLLYFRVNSKYINRLFTLKIMMKKGKFIDEVEAYYAYLHYLSDESEENIKFIHSTITKLPYSFYNDLTSRIALFIIKDFGIIDESPDIRIAWDLGVDPTINEHLVES